MSQGQKAVGLYPETLCVLTSDRLSSRRVPGPEYCWRGCRFYLAGETKKGDLLTHDTWVLPRDYVKGRERRKGEDGR